MVTFRKAGGIIISGDMMAELKQQYPHVMQPYIAPGESTNNELLGEHRNLFHANSQPSQRTDVEIKQQLNEITHESNITWKFNKDHSQLWVQITSSQDISKIEEILKAREIAYSNRKVKDSDNRCLLVSKEDLVASLIPKLTR